VWYLEEYYIYTTVIFTMALVSLLTELRESRETLGKLKALAQYDCEMKVQRDNGFQSINSVDLVPGDIVQINPFKVPCDMILLQGKSSNYKKQIRQLCC
jgi:cation-transporting P-type ATPase 13A2